MNRASIAAVFVGGAVGTLVRAALTEGLPTDPASWPWATLVANLTACLLLGWVVARLVRSPAADPRARPLLATGLCGGLSTFSTLQVELVRLLDDGAVGIAAAYAAVSIVGGLAAVALGGAIGRAGPRAAGVAA